MIIDPAFETMAEKFNLDLSHNEEIYLHWQTGMSQYFYTAKDVEIEKLKHDLANEKAANLLLNHLHDNLLDRCKALGVEL
jgi:hypothetical protein